MKDDFLMFQKLKDGGATAQTCLFEAQNSGLNGFAQIRMLRCVFNLSLVEAKEIYTLAGSKVESLNEHQGGLLSPLKTAIETSEEDPK
jgi:hypothetical protein